MNNEKKLPKNWLVEIRNDGSTIDARFKQWYQIESNDTYSFTSFYYGKNRHGDFVNVDDKPDYYNLLTLEEWDSIVNKKSIEFKTKEQLGEIEPIFIWGEHSPTNPPKREGRAEWDSKKVMGKRTEDSNILSPYDVLKVGHAPPIKTNPFIVKNIASGSIADTSKTFELKDGAYSESKQPRLKVGDNIPEYLDNKLSYYHDENVVHGYFYTAGEHIVISVEKEKYNVQIDEESTIWGLEISEVDALIEEHERETQKDEFIVELNPNEGNGLNHQYKGSNFSLEDLNGNGVMEKWEPKNGDEVGASLDIHPLNSVRGIYIGEDNGGYLIRRLSDNTYHTYDYVFRVPKKITVTHKEIAEWKGCDVEQLQIIKD